MSLLDPVGTYAPWKLVLSEGGGTKMCHDAVFSETRRYKRYRSPWEYFLQRGCGLSLWGDQGHVLRIRRVALIWILMIRRVHC